jgi:hypothetical protein
VLAAGLAESAIHWSYGYYLWRGHWSSTWWVALLAGAVGVCAESRAWLWVLRLTFLLAAIGALVSFSSPSMAKTYDVFDREWHVATSALSAGSPLVGLVMLALLLVVRARHDGGGVDGGGARG